jgi:hypothetical protein
VRRQGYHALRCATCGYAVTTCARLGCRPISDQTPIRTLRQLNKMLGAEAAGWTLVRGAGYYYFVHPEHAPSAGIMTYTIHGTTLGF